MIMDKTKIMMNILLIHTIKHIMSLLRPKVQFFCLPMCNNVNHQRHHMDANEVITVYLELINKICIPFKGPI